MTWARTFRDPNENFISCLHVPDLRNATHHSPSGLILYASNRVEGHGPAGRCWSTLEGTAEFWVSWSWTRRLSSEGCWAWPKLEVGSTRIKTRNDNKVEYECPEASRFSSSSPAGLIKPDHSVCNHERGWAAAVQDRTNLSRSWARGKFENLSTKWM